MDRCRGQSGDTPRRFRRDIAVVERRYGYPVEQWQLAKEQVREALAARARQRLTIAYSDLVRSVAAIQLDPDSPALAAILGEISTEEDFAGRGMLSVVVVHKHGDKMPGPGFFELARQLGRDVTDELSCWANEMRRVQEVWTLLIGGDPFRERSDPDRSL